MPSLLVALFGTAWAQAPAGSGFDAHGFRLAAHDADPRDPLVVSRAGAFDGQNWFVGGVVEYAAQPLIFDTGRGVVTELDNLVAANLSVGYAPVDRLRLDLALPLFLYGEGTEGALGAGLGDIRATAQLQLVRPEPRSGGLGTAIVTNLDLPTGRPGDWLGQTTLSGGVGLALTYEMERLTFSAVTSTQLRPNTPLDERPAPTKGGDAFAWGAGVGYLVTEETGLNLEVHGEVAADDEIRTAIGVPVEALLSMRHVRADGGFLTAGIGTGLTRGAGAAPVRLLLGGGFGNAGDTRPGDMDGDGINDYDDRCPATPETINGFLDDDGCRDELPELTFRAIGPGGNVRDDAGLRVSGPEGFETAADTGPVVLGGAEVQPDSAWTATASLGACLEGTVEHTMGTRSTTVDVPMTRKRTGEVTVRVVDAEGQPVDDVVVRFRSEEEPCTPDRFTDFTDGVGVVPVGPGVHFAFVTANGYRVQQKMFSMEPDGTAEVEVELEAALAKLDTSDPDHTVITILDKVYFDTGKATIQERSHELLDQVAEVITVNGVTALEVAGHTDSQGAEASNLELSQGRAEAVKTYLESKGVPDGVLTAKGYGEGQPIADNKTVKGRAENRRVEFSVLSRDEPEP